MCKAKLLDVEAIQVFDLADLVGPQRQHLQALVCPESFNPADLILVKVKLLEEGVRVNVLDQFNLIVRIVCIFKVGWWVEVKQRRDLVVASIQFDEVLYRRERLQTGQVVV